MAITDWNPTQSTDTGASSGPQPWDPTLSPDESSQVLGHSNGMLMNFLSGAYNVEKNLATGVAKGGTETMLGIGGLGQKVEQGLGNLVGQIPGVSVSPQAKGQQSVFNPQSAAGQAAHQIVTPQNTAETVGKTAEHIGEFFIPGGAEKLAAEKGASYIDKLPEALGLGEKAAKYITGGLKTALSGLIGGTSMGAVTAAQTGGDVQATKGAAKFGGVAGAVSGALQAFGPSIAEALNKADFKLSPAKEAKAGKIADNAAQFITKNQVTGSDATKFSKLSNINSELENTLQSSLPNEIAVPKNEIISNIESNVESLRQSDPAIYNQARSKADEAIQLIKQQPGDNAFTKGGTVSVKDALQGKRSWGSMAFKTSNKAKIDPTVSAEGAYAVEQGYQKALEDTLGRTNTAINIPSSLSRYFDGKTSVTLPEFNKVYSDAINAKNLTGIAQYKNDAGLFGRLFGLWVGKSIGHAIAPGLAGEVVGGGLGEMASTHIPGVARNLMERSLYNTQLPGQVAKVMQGAENAQ